MAGPTASWQCPCSRLRGRREPCTCTSARARLAAKRSLIPRGEIASTPYRAQPLVLPTVHNARLTFNLSGGRSPYRLQRAEAGTVRRERAVVCGSTGGLRSMTEVVSVEISPFDGREPNGGRALSIVLRNSSPRLGTAPQGRLLCR